MLAAVNPTSRICSLQSSRSIAPTCTLLWLQVLATSRGDYSGPAEAIGAEFFGDIDDFAEEHPDVVILATSILSTAAVLESLPIARFRRSTLFVDVLSVKEFPKQLLLDRLPRQVGWRILRRFLLCAALDDLLSGACMRGRAGMLGLPADAGEAGHTLAALL